jgi:hypothetical protein
MKIFQKSSGVFGNRLQKLRGEKIAILAYKTRHFCKKGQGYKQVAEKLQKLHTLLLVVYFKKQKLFIYQRCSFSVTSCNFCAVTKSSNGINGLGVFFGLVTNVTSLRQGGK